MLVRRGISPLVFYYLMEIKLDLQLYKSFVKIADCKGYLQISPFGGKLTETVGGNFIKSKIISALREAGFKGKVVIDNEEYDL